MGYLYLFTINRLTEQDFLLVFYDDLRSRQNHCRQRQQTLTTNNNDSACHKVFYQPLSFGDKANNGLMSDSATYYYYY